MMSLADLPQIKISRHARAKHLRLRVDAFSIRLTAPIFSSAQQIQLFIEQSRPWLLETWQKQQTKLQHEAAVLSTELKLFNQEDTVKIHYCEQQHPLRFDVQQLQLSIRETDSEVGLKTFIKAYAKQHLPDYLAQVSQECQLSYQACKVREARTRWGSCSAKHDIMLNAALALCPEHIVRYVCVHELAHTRHFDHSPAFWAEVEQHDPNYQQHRKELKNIKMPSWYLS